MTKPVKTPGNPWGHCDQCGAPFVVQNEWHRYCCGVCRQQAHRGRHRPQRNCPGCNRLLIIGQPHPEHGTVNVRTRYCSQKCRMAVYLRRRKGRLLTCQNEGCPRHGVPMVHTYDAESDSWKCRGCGQLQPADW